MFILVYNYWNNVPLVISERILYVRSKLHFCKCYTNSFVTEQLDLSLVQMPTVAFAEL